MLKFYKSVLAFAGMHVDKEDYIKSLSADEQIQVIVKGKPLVLPTRDHLNTISERGVNGKMTAIKEIFHPLKENVIKNESVSVTKLRQAISARFNYSLFILMEKMLILASDREKQKKLKGESLKFLTMFSGIGDRTNTAAVDEKSLKIFERLIESGMKTGIFSNLISIFNKRGGYLGKERFSRLSVVGFPLYEEILAAEKRKVRGTKLRVKDEEVFLAMYRFIFPDIDSETCSFNTGSSNPTSPSLDSLLRAAEKISDRILYLQEAFSFMYDNDELENYDVEWLEYLYTLEDHKGDILAVPLHDTEKVLEKPKTPVVAPWENQPVSKPSVPTDNLVRTSRGLDPRSIGGGQHNPMMSPGHNTGYNGNPMLQGNQNHQPVNNHQHNTGYNNNGYGQQQNYNNYNQNPMLRRMY